MKNILLITALLFTCPAWATTVTHGSLTSDDATNIIHDSLNNYEWMRLDVLAPLTYEQTLFVLDTAEGGGWGISGYTEAHMFVSAILSATGNVCTPDDIEACGNDNDWVDGDFGDNFDATADYAWYLTDAGRAGYFTIDTNGDVVLRGWSSLAASDAYADGGTLSDTPVTWLVYREASVIPVPAAVWLFGSGLLGLVAVARRRS